MIIFIKTAPAITKNKILKYETWSICLSPLALKGVKLYNFGEKNMFLSKT